ncbi:hypothetical protein C8J57DRAFT_1632418 [Mycena rebaudengoi]|nr:hypothetical protein C8J57DRAFT_1632418 [Mycena rebaudengoi]
MSSESNESNLVPGLSCDAPLRALAVDGATNGGGMNTPESEPLLRDAPDTGPSRPAPSPSSPKHRHPALQRRRSKPVLTPHKRAQLQRDARVRQAVAQHEGPAGALRVLDHVCDGCRVRAWDGVSPLPCTLRIFLGQRDAILQDPASLCAVLNEDFTGATAESVSGDEWVCAGAVSLLRAGAMCAGGDGGVALRVVLPAYVLLSRRGVLLERGGVLRPTFLVGGMRRARPSLRAGLLRSLRGRDDVVAVPAIRQYRLFSSLFSPFIRVLALVRPRPGRLCTRDEGLLRGAICAGGDRRCTVIAFFLSLFPLPSLPSYTPILTPLSICRNNQFEMTTALNANSFVTAPPPGSFLASSIEGKPRLYLLPTLTSDVIPFPQILDGAVYNITPDLPLNTPAYLAACSGVSNATLGKILPPVMSARVNTRRSVSIKFGRVEIRAEPTGDWPWSALWMLPVEDVYGGWPLSGESRFFVTSCPAGMFYVEAFAGF